MKSCCIADNCGAGFDSDIRETRANLRSFWQLYCPKHRTAGNAGEPAISAISSAASIMGRLGGASKSERKRAAVRKMDCSAACPRTNK